MYVCLIYFKEVERAIEKKTLLLVNSSESLMYITKKILERCGHSVCCAQDIDTVWEMIREYRPDGIVLDNEMPDCNGFEYCRELRKDSSVPIMFISASKEDEIPALATGADGFMAKPLEYEIMKARINSLLKVGNGEIDEQDASRIVSQYPTDKKEKGNGAPRWRRIKARQVLEHYLRERNKIAMCLSIGAAAAGFLLAILAIGGIYLIGSTSATTSQI